MARFDTSGLDELLADMQRMEQQTGPVAEAMTMAAAEIIKQSWQRSAEEHGYNDSRQTDRPNNIQDLVLAFPQEDGFCDFTDTDVHVSGVDVDHDHHCKRSNHDRKHDRAPCAAPEIFCMVTA